MGLTINKLLTPYNFTNANNTGRIKYIVIHYVGALGGAKANCQYYAGQYVGASAHYYVGFDGEYWQSVLDEDIAWHCGASTYKHPECRNSNSIGIELCVRKKSTQSMQATDKDWYFEEATVNAAVALTKELMKKYGVTPDRVIRHYDVTGKICPNPFVYNNTAYTWDTFKAALSPSETKRKKNSDGTYTVKQGDTLTAIGKSFQVSVNELKKWNELSSDMIVVGQKLQFWYWKGIVSKNNLPLKEAAGASKKTILKLPKGAKVETLEETKSKAGNKWYKIRYDNTVGYVYGKRIQKIKE